MSRSDPVNHSDQQRSESTNYEWRAPLNWEGSAVELFTITIQNLLFRILTLNIYHFWAKTRVRNYIWSEINLNGEKLRYTGKGSELFWAFVRFMLIAGGIFALIQVVLVFYPSVALEALMNLVVGLGFVGLVGAGRYFGRRYLYSRTVHRGIRIGLTGNGWMYCLLFAGSGIASYMTLGLLHPLMRYWRIRYTTGHTWYGNLNIKFFGKPGPMLAGYLKRYIFIPFTLGLIWFWWRAWEMRYVTRQLQLGDLEIRMTHSGWDYARLKIGNFFIRFLTLGFGKPWAIQRNVRFLDRYLWVRGEIDYESLEQSAARVPRTGEGMIEFIGANIPVLGITKV